MPRKSLQPTTKPQDGWFSPSSSREDTDSSSSSSDEESTLNIGGYSQQLANSILVSKTHSLQPDMMFGWRPKLPSCPLPLTYPNAYVDSLMTALPRDSRFSIAYVGPKYVNSVQMNQQFQYSWKYRDRYSMNLGLVKEVVERVGREENNLGLGIGDSNRQTVGQYEIKHILKQENGDMKENKQNRSSSFNCKLLGNRSEFTFQSRFQSGNLQLAVRVKATQYDCFIRSDTNTKGHTNWYFFKVSNGSQLGQLKLNICNITKSRNLYSKGMKPYVLQRSENEKDSIDGHWSQDPCYDVMFVERYCRYGFEHKGFQLQFRYNFKAKNKHVYFAYAVPYTYSKLERFVKEIVEDCPEIVKIKRLCESLGGLDIPLLCISNHAKGLQNSEARHDKSLFRTQNYAEAGDFKKKAVLLTGRIHPGQSNASYVIEGFIRQLLKDTPQANYLRNIFNFYVVPMINPDGVIAGNFRTSYSGKDLNRQFTNPDKYIFPEISALHSLAMQLKNSYPKGVQFYMDFHGHSVKKGLFCYGPQHHPSNNYFFKSRAMAKVIQSMHPIFSYKKSIFTINEHKKSTGRAHMLWKVKIPMTFTFEISNGMYEDKNRNDVYLTKELLQEAGRTVYRGFSRYVQLEMGFSIKNIGLKKDQSANRVQSSKQILGKRVIHSSKSIRPINRQNSQNRTCKAIPIGSAGQAIAVNDRDDDRGKKDVANEMAIAERSLKSRKHRLRIPNCKDNISGNIAKGINNKSKGKIKCFENITDDNQLGFRQTIDQGERSSSNLGYVQKESHSLIALFREIKEQTKKAVQGGDMLGVENVDYEGGSDSQGSEQDLSKQQTKKLFKQIVSRNNTRDGYKNNNWRTKNVKLNMRKRVTENPNNIGQNEKGKEEEIDKQKYRSSRLDELSKPYNYLNGVMRIQRKGTSIQCEKIVVAQKHFIMNL